MVVKIKSEMERLWGKAVVAYLEVKGKDKSVPLHARGAQRVPGN